jgi:peptidoglycan/LPS O-acetylase OafA/YrhL
MKYVPALDGVRCFAVLIVAMYHFHILAAGWLGVQVFFELSGFLNSSILLDAKERHAETFFKRFYWRRTLRIFPLYFAYLAVAAVAFALFAVPAAWGELWGWLITYTSNFSRMMVYDKGTEFFVHFWSLAVEEQFYLLWPLTVFLLSRTGLKRFVLLLLVGVPLMRLGLGAWLFAQGFPDERVARVVGVFTFSQFDAFAAGAALALFPTDRIRMPGLAAIGALGIFLATGAFMLATIPTGTPGFGIDTFGHHATTINGYHVWGPTVINLASAALILAALRGSFRWILANPVAVQIGKVSYGVYVLHLPMHYWLVRYVTFKHSTVAGLGIFVAYFAAVVLVAMISYRFFETPFLRLKERMA